jgi:hypothetical protein
MKGVLRLLCRVQIRHLVAGQKSKSVVDAGLDHTVSERREKIGVK